MPATRASVGRGDGIILTKIVVTIIVVSMIVVDEVLQPHR
jgi:hypothetical protein